MISRSLCGASLLLFAATLSAQTRSVTPDEAIAQLRPEAIDAHLRFLADDLLEGRGTGTRGYDLAAKYVASELASYGLEPAGASGFEQQVPLRRVLLGASTVEYTRGDDTVKLNADADYVASPLYHSANSSVDAPLIFGGYGITAPELGRDDYKGLDATGKVVLLMRGSPSDFPIYPRAHYSGTLVKMRNAVAHGAVGVVFVDPPESDKGWGWERTVANTKLPFVRWIEKSGEVHNAPRELRTILSMNRDAAASMFGSKSKLEALFEATRRNRKGPRTPAITLRASVSESHESISSPNIVAMLRGSDPQLRDEYVVYSSHLDHLGVGVPVNGDAIYNGATDNAAGVAGLLEVARAFTRMNPRPRRSIIFLFVTAEEKGLIGSDYYANNPTVPQKNIVANINIDGLTMDAPIADIVALGAENSTIGDAVQRVASKVNLQLSPDPSPEEAYFVRSDQYSFVKVGVPAVYAEAGVKVDDSSVDMNAVEKSRSERYHRPSDDLSHDFNLASGAKLVRFHFLTGVELANADARPQWREGDFFAKLFGQGR